MNTWAIDDSWDEAIADLIAKEETERRALHEPSGKISASMVGYPALDGVLKLVGLPGKEFDTYLLRKFARGNQVEDWLADKMAVSSETKFKTQVELSYREGIGFADLVAEGDIPHEIKSVTNAKFKRITKGMGRNPTADGPDLHHVLQACWYALALGSPVFYLHYAASDDLRLISYKIPTMKYASLVDSQIDKIQRALDTGILPDFEPVISWQGNKDYATFPEFLNMTGEQAEAYLREFYPEQYKRLKKGSK